MEELPWLKNNRDFSVILARVGLIITAFFALVAIFADFIAPYDPVEQDRSRLFAPPSVIYLQNRADSSAIGLFTNEVRLTDPLSLRYEEIPESQSQVGFFVEGFRYKIFGVFESDLHLFGVVNGPAKIRLLGSDALGRDRFSRLVFAIRNSLFAAPIGTLLASFIGILIGLISGYASRTVDLLLMGLADAMLSLPSLIVILAARAAFPLDLPPYRAVVLLIVIFSIVGWAEMARLCRGLVRSLRGQEFVIAARALGAHPIRILVSHILPNVAGPIVTQATVMLPAFLIAEISLSFLGVGVQEPMPSLGNLLAEAADLSRLTASPLIVMMPALAIFGLVLGVRLTALGRRSKGDLI